MNNRGNSESCLRIIAMDSIKSNLSSKTTARAPASGFL